VRLSRGAYAKYGMGCKSRRVLEVVEHQLVAVLLDTSVEVPCVLGPATTKIIFIALHKVLRMCTGHVHLSHMMTSRAARVHVGFMLVSIFALDLPRRLDFMSRAACWRIRKLGVGAFHYCSLRKGGGII